MSGPTYHRNGQKRNCFRQNVIFLVKNVISPSQKRNYFTCQTGLYLTLTINFTSLLIKNTPLDNLSNTN